MKEIVKNIIAGLVFFTLVGLAVVIIVTGF